METKLNRKVENHMDKFKTNLKNQIDQLIIG